VEVFETPGDVTLQVRIPSGRVVIGTSDEPMTQIELVPLGRRGHEAIEQIEISHQARGGRHIVSVEQRDRIRWGPIQISWGGDVEVRVTCPQGTTLELSGASTDFSADGSFGGVGARTASGDLWLGAVAGDLEVKTASGDVQLGRVESEKASLVTVSGDVQVGHAERGLSLRTVSGDVKFGVARGSVTIATTSGDVDVHSLESGELRIQTVSGDSRVGVAAGTRIWIDASSISGDLKSELAMGEEAPEDAAAEAAVVPVHVKSVSGDVSIVRAAARVG
jgi:Putative adhesin